jgi:hypothetical protein
MLEGDMQTRLLLILVAMTGVIMMSACASSPAGHGGDGEPVQIASLGVPHSLLADRDDPNWEEPIDQPHGMKKVPTNNEAAAAGGAKAAGAKAGGHDHADLAKKSNNPIADLISVPFQNNWNYNFGPRKKNQYNCNIQPVWPFALGDDWLLITRTIVPVVSNPSLVPGDDRDWGLGNTLFSGWVIPPSDGELMWGVGPAIQLPTSTARQFGPSEWGAGPTAVLVWLPEGWIIGSLVNNVWGFDDPSDTNNMVIQPFLIHMLEDGWYLASSPVITAKWREDYDDRWLVPLGGGIGKVFSLGKGIPPINATLRGYYNVRRAEYAPNWTLQLQITFLFPK